jgi:hypothetical protein
MSLLPLSKNLLEKILRPINRLTESCVLNVGQNNIYSICSSIDNTVILYAKIKTALSLENKSHKLNLISIKKLLSGLECLGDSGEFSLELENNYIKCQSVDYETQEKTYFKYHLVDDSIVKEAPVNIDKIAALKFDTEFLISQSKIKQIMSGYAFASDVTKIYFHSKEGKIIAEIDDKTLQNVDNITINVSKDYVGSAIEEHLPISMEIFKNLALCKTDIKVKINNQYKVFIFSNIEDENVELKYIISALVK